MFLKSYRYLLERHERSVFPMIPDRASGDRLSANRLLIRVPWKHTSTNDEIKGIDLGSEVSFIVMAKISSSIRFLIKRFFIRFNKENTQ